MNLFFCSSPFEAHHNSEASSNIARKTIADFRDHQRDAKKLFSAHPEHHYTIGDRVLVMAKRATFYKYAPIFTNIFESDIYVVRNIKRYMLPYIYELSKLDSHTITKRLYSFEMKRFKDNVHVPNKTSNKTSNTTSTTTSNNALHVIDVILKDGQRTLRSGRTMSLKPVVFYRVEHDNKQKIINEPSLRLLKRTVGSINYSSFFDLDSNRQYVL